MSEPTRWQRMVRWVAERLLSWLPPECGIIAPTGDVYCTLIDGHEGRHGWEVQP